MAVLAAQYLRVSTEQQMALGATIEKPERLLILN